MLTLVLVGIFGLFHPQRITVKPAASRALAVDDGAGHHYQLTANQAVGFRFVEGKVDYFLHRELHTASGVTVTGVDGGEAEMLVSVPGKIERRFQGKLRVTPEAGALLAVLSMDGERAIGSAVAAESPAGAGAEALKAQAVVSRSWYAASPRRHTGFDFCDTTHCQFLREPPRANEAARRAAEATRGQVLTHQQSPVPALFSASCGGSTLTAHDAGLDPGPYPFFKVECETCRRAEPVWEKRFPVAEAAALLDKPHSEPLRLALTRKHGWSALPGNNYEIERQGETVLFKGHGRGHGVGLCQEGAAGMARAGADYLAILRHYFPNTAVSSARSR